MEAMLQLQHSNSTKMHLVPSFNHKHHLIMITTVQELNKLMYKQLIRVLRLLLVLELG